MTHVHVCVHACGIAEELVTMKHFEAALTYLRHEPPLNCYLAIKNSDLVVASIATYTQASLLIRKRWQTNTQQM